MANQVTSIDKGTMEGIRKAINAALAPLGEGMGLTILATRGTYDRKGGFGTFKLELALAGTSRAAEEFKQVAHLFGLRPEWLGETFQDMAGHTFTIVGANAARKFPILTERDGRNYQFAAEGVRMGLAKRGLVAGPSKAGTLTEVPHA